MDYKEMKIEDIITWCKENNQVAWLKENALKTTPMLDEAGQPILTKKGKPREKKVSFIELKIAFVEKFMPEIAPTRHEKTTMYDLIKNL